ncbi:MAG: thiamine pyridinylase, partial [Azovibrio sp.]
MKMVSLYKTLTRKLASVALAGTLLIAWGGVIAQQQLTVGLYPYVPRVDQFRDVIEAEWRTVHPSITLNFLNSDEWDGGYDKDPPPQADVYVFDATYFDYFRSRNWLEPLAPQEIQGLADFMPYASNGVRVGEKYYAIPQLGCASLLFYDKNDRAMVSVTTVSGLHNTLNQCTYISRIPPDRRGLMVDMSGGTTTAMLYVSAAHSLNGFYPFPLPINRAEINADAIKNLRTILTTGSILNATRPTDDPYQYAAWISNGWGRAYVGYSESISRMTDHERSQVA